MFFVWISLDNKKILQQHFAMFFKEITKENNLDG